MKARPPFATPGSSTTTATVRAAVLLGACLACTNAYANTMVPVVFVTMVGVTFALIPIILIELVVVCKSLALPAKSVVVGVVAANLASTAAGYLLMVLEFFGGGLKVAEERVASSGLVFTAFFVLLSVAIERPVLNWRIKNVDQVALTWAAIHANIASYSLLAAFYIGRIVKRALVDAQIIVDF